MDIMDIRDIMEVMDILDIMDIIDIMDIMDIMILTACLAMAGAVLALVKVHLKFEAQALWIKIQGFS